MFTHTYAADVAGVVLIMNRTPAPATTATPPDLGAVSITNRFLTNLLTLPAQVGLVRLMTGPVAGLSSDDANASVNARSLEATIDEGYAGESRAGAPNHDPGRRAPHRPLARAAGGWGEKWQREQTELLQLLFDSHQVFADQSHHNIQFEQPVTAVGTIVQMVEQIRRQAVSMPD